MENEKQAQAANSQKNPQRLKGVWETLEGWQRGLATLLFFGSLFWMASSFIDWKVKSALESEKVISELSKRIRPFLIFDAKGHYLMNVGCEGLIEVEILESNKAVPVWIKVKSAKTLPIAPLLSALNPYSVDAVPYPAEGNNWVYKVEAVMLLSESAPPPARFKLEIVQ